MQRFGTAEVSRLTNIPMREVRAMVRARYVSPARGLRGALRFSFHDLVLLRTASYLLAEGISRRRMGQALRSVRAQLPTEMPARGLSVTARGGRVVIHDAGEQRDALSGQLLLTLETRNEVGNVELIEAAPRGAAAAAPDDCERAFEAALALEDTDVDAAMDAYRACVSQHAHGGARANLGRLLHLQGRISDALALYLAGDPADADVIYNQAVALEDLGRIDEAIGAYARVIELEPGHLEANHNIARLWQQAGDHRRALRYWNTYRRLSRAD